MPDIEPVTKPHGDSSKKGLLSNTTSSNSLRPGSAQLPQYSEVWEEEGGKEVVQAEDGKEVVPHQGLEADIHSSEKHVAVPLQEKEAFLGPSPPQENESKSAGKRICGMRKRPFLLVVGIFIVCCIILGLALGLNLNKSHK